MFFLNNKNDARVRQTKKGGFLLIELIVAIFIFGIVMTVSMGALVTALDSNRKTQSLKSVLNNLNIVLDTMTKSLAVGIYYRCADYDPAQNVKEQVLDCPSGSNDNEGVSFLFNEDSNDNGEIDDVINYRFVPGIDGDSGYLARVLYCTTASDDDCSEDPVVVRMTAPEVNITDAKFFVSGSERAGEEQPKVLIVVRGISPAGPRALPTEFMVQTLVSQRVPNFIED